MKRLAGVALVLCSACGAPPPAPAPVDDNHGYGFAYDIASDDGTRLRFGTVALDQSLFAQFFDRPYLEVEACMATLAPGPLVVIASPAAIAPKVGVTYLGADPLVLVADTYQFDARVVRHEYVHYLLDRSGLPEADNGCHRSPFFLACAGYDPGGCS